jgi:hypothetical protein
MKWVTPQVSTMGRLLSFWSDHSRAEVSSGSRVLPRKGVGVLEGDLA